MEFTRVLRHPPAITLSMLVRNEADRYLGRLLDAARGYIDRAVIVDDGSTDGTAELCREKLAGIPLRLIAREQSGFHSEWQVRRLQWDATVADSPDWILSLDADELFEARFADGVRRLVESADCDVWLFRLYDFWDEHHYREDGLWSAHRTYRPFLTRYQPHYPYTFRRTDQHCGRLPENILGLPHRASDLRLRHMGWARESDRREKYERYLRLDPEGRYGSMEQYQSILQKEVRLIPWREHEY